VSSCIVSQNSEPEILSRDIDVQVQIKA